MTGFPSSCAQPAAGAEFMQGSALYVGKGSAFDDCRRNQRLRGNCCGVLRECRFLGAPSCPTILAAFTFPVAAFWLFAAQCRSSLMPQRSDWPWQGRAEWVPLLSRHGGASGPGLWTDGK